MEHERKNLGEFRNERKIGGILEMEKRADFYGQELPESEGKASANRRVFGNAKNEAISGIPQRLASLFV